MSFRRSLPGRPLCGLTSGLLVFLLAASPSLAQTVADSPRPLVLMLPGRGVDAADSTSLRREWLDALNQGFVNADAYPLLGERDLRLVWYADALDPRAPVACAAGRTRAATTELTSIFGAVGTLMGVVADISGEHEGAALRALAGDLLYLGDDRKRCAAEERLGDALAAAAREDRPVVLVAHSFGSLVAYHHLRTRDSVAAPRIERLVTIGSLIGRPELRELLLGPEGRRGRVPARVGSWVNVRDPDDPFAAPLVGVHPDPATPDAVLDRTTERSHPGDPHDATRYLMDPAAARAILEAWCGALTEAGASQPSCRAGAPTDSPR